MAKTSGFLSETRGKLNDSFQTRQTVNGTILARSPRKASTPRRSEKQMFMRCQLSNVAANHQLYNDRLLLAFEGKPSGVSVYNMMKFVCGVMMKQRSGKIVNVASVAGLYSSVQLFLSERDGGRGCSQNPP